TVLNALTTRAPGSLSAINCADDGPSSGPNTPKRLVGSTTILPATSPNCGSTAATAAPGTDTMISSLSAAASPTPARRASLQALSAACAFGLLGSRTPYT